MTTIPMFDVVPVTGPNQGERVCYVCKLGSEPVIVLFIRPETLEASPLPVALQQLSDQHPELQAFIVCLSAPTPDMIRLLQATAATRQLRVPLVLLPNGSLPSSVPVDPAVNDTILLYRGRQLRQKFENTGRDNPLFERFSPPVADAFQALDAPAAFQALDAPLGSARFAAGDQLQPLRDSTQELLDKL